MTALQSTTAAAKSRTAISASDILQTALAVCFGVFMVGMVGFSHIDAVHNAAHDVRHANGFPCH